jgi:DNA-binding NarL/FixJ family response regulator
MKPIRVLIVDDMSQVRQDLRTVLALAGTVRGIAIEVVGEAANGQEALLQAGALHPDVVLMDLAMPGMDGWTATRLIKASDPTIRVAALSVHEDPESRRQAHLAGVEAFLVKGVPVAEILRAIRQG